MADKAWTWLEQLPTTLYAAGVNFLESAKRTLLRFVNEYIAHSSAIAGQGSKKDQILSRYNIVKALSKGWAGTVYLAEDRENGNLKRALKVQPLVKSPSTIGNNPKMESKAGEYLNGLIRDGKTVAFVETIESFQYWNFIDPSWLDKTFKLHTYWYIVSELVEGDNLKAVLRKRTDTKVTVDFLRSVIFQVLYALLVAQRELHFTHYDVWAKNIMLTKRVRPAQVNSNADIELERPDGAVPEPENSEEELWTFKLDGHTYYIPASHTDRQICKIFDYGLSRVEVRKKSGQVVEVVEDRNILHHHFNAPYDMKNFCFSMLEKIDPGHLEELFTDSPQLHDVFSKMLGLETASATVRVISRFGAFDLFRPHKRVLEVAKSIHSSRWFDLWARWTWVLNVHDTQMRISDVLSMPFFRDTYAEHRYPHRHEKQIICLGEFGER